MDKLFHDLRSTRSCRRSLQWIRRGRTIFSRYEAGVFKKESRPLSFSKLYRSRQESITITLLRCEWTVSQDLQVALKEVSADADIAKAQAHALENELEQVRLSFTTK